MESCKHDNKSKQRCIETKTQCKISSKHLFIEKQGNQGIYALQIFRKNKEASQQLCMDKSEEDERASQVCIEKDEIQQVREAIHGSRTVSNV